MKPSPPSPALAIACLALFSSLGGVSYGVATGYIDSREIKNDTVRHRDIRNNDIRGRDIRNSTILGRDVAFNTLRGADIDESRLARVPDADKLDGADSTAFLRRDAAGFVSLPVASGWTAGTGGDAPQVDVDPLGNVQLRGAVERVGGGATALTLPAGARPASRRRFVAWGSDDAPVLVTVEPGGAVLPAGNNGTVVSLDGVIFRADAR